MAEKIVTVKTWEEFKNAMNCEIDGSGGGGTLTISIMEDLTDTEQHALPAPAENYWAKISAINAGSNPSVIKILGNNHTISGINIPDNYYTALLLCKQSGSSSKINIDIYNLKFVNIKTPTMRVSAYISGGDSRIYHVELTNCTITGLFDLYGDIYQLTQCNIVQVSPRTQDIWDRESYYFISKSLKYTHYYYTHLNNITRFNRQPAQTLDNCYIELNPGTTNLAEYTIIGGWKPKLAEFNQSCINCNKNLGFSFDTTYTTAKGITILNCTNDPAPDIPSSFAKNIKIITDEQMKNADYLNSIGFTVTPTN